VNRRFVLSLLFGTIAQTLLGLPAGAKHRGWPPLPGRKPALGPKATIVLDPGHGGRDPGAIGARGTREKDVTLAICRAIRNTLAGLRGVRVVLTRDGDTYMTLPERVAIAGRWGAELFISIHADAAPNPAARGLSAYTLAEKASDDLAAALAARENQVDSIYGVDLSGADRQTAAILIDLARRHSHNSALLAQRKLIDHADGKLRLLENPLRAADFAVLKSPEVPSLLVETGFLSNRHDETLLRDERSRARIAAVLAAAMGTIASELKSA
jgi:N-acetylmuramoyl-L-alanine amidase